MIDPAATATGIYTQQRLAAGAVLAGRFRIEGVLGVGGMGVVYRATDLTLDVPVALKLLRPELALRTDALERFRQELLTARQVSSPRVVRIHDLAHDGDQWFITMDLVDGESLDRLIDREGPLQPDDATRIARELAEGLAAAHARDVIHRDLKPANVLVDRGGHVYISDFGVARSLASGGLTQSGAVVGTPDYLSPEQARGETLDARSDLYALGLILYEMLTGTMPFSGGTVPEMLAQRMLRTPPPVTQLKPQTPAWLVRLVDRLLRPQPAHRLQSAQDVIRAIDRREVPRDWRPLRRPLWASAAVAAAIAIAGVGLWQWRQDAAPAVVANVAPLHRLLVLPLQAPASALPEARRVALGALAREALVGVPGLAVVDDERTFQAVRQIDPTGTARIDAAAIRDIVGADRTLEIILQPQGGGWQATARLHRDGASAPPLVASAPSPRGALSELFARPALATALGLGGQRPVLALPRDERALDLYGAGLLARRGDRLALAVDHFGNAAKQAPAFAPAWIALADAATLIGEQDIAYDALERGERATVGLTPALQRRLRAGRATLDGDAPAAIAQWRAQLAATRDDTHAQLELAKALGLGGDFQAAIAELQSLVARDPNDARAWFELGKFSILHGQPRRAVEDYLVRALVLFKRSGNRFGEAETVNALGIGYGRLAQIDDAEEQYRKAVELRRAVGNRRGLATSLRNLANVLVSRGRLDEAARHYEQARALHAELGDRDGLAAVEHELGLLAEERGDYTAALDAFRRALTLWKQLGHRPGVAQALNDIGFAQYQLGAYDDAQAYLVQANEAFTGLGDNTGRIRTQQNLGQLAIARGDWDDARRRLQASLEDAERRQMFEEAAVSRRNLAELELSQGHLDAALRQAQSAEALFERRDDVRGRIDAALLRAQAWAAAGRHDRARAALDKLDASLAQASPEQRGIAALLRAGLAQSAGDVARHRAALEQARRAAEASGVRLLQLQVALESSTDARDPALASAVASLGHAGLRLRWTESAMTRALAAGDASGAARLYRDAMPQLRRGDALRASALHALGARALAALGDAHAATVAREHAQASHRTLESHLPADAPERATAARTD